MNLLIVFVTSALLYLYVYAFLNVVLIIFGNKKPNFTNGKGITYNKEVSAVLLLLSSIVFIYAAYNDNYFIIIDYAVFCLIDYYAGKLHCLMTKQDFDIDYKFSSLSLAVFIISVNYVLLNLGILTDSIFISFFQK